MIRGKHPHYIKAFELGLCATVHFQQDSLIKTDELGSLHGIYHAAITYFCLFLLCKGGGRQRIKKTIK